MKKIKFKRKIKETTLLKVFGIVFLCSLLCGALGNTWAICICGAAITVVSGIATLVLANRCERDYNSNNN